MANEIKSEIKSIILEDNKQAQFEIKTVQTAHAAKELSQEGIDFVTQGTNSKAKADKLLVEGREVMNRAEQAFTDATNLDIRTSNLDEKIISETENLSAEMENQTNLEKQLTESRAQTKLIRLSIEKDTRELKLTKADSASTHNLSEELKDRANKLLENGAKTAEESVEAINKGNALIEEAAALSNATQRKLVGHTTNEFTKEIRTDLTQEFVKE